MRKEITIYDIAAQQNLSTPTVSRALAEDPVAKRQATRNLILNSGLTIRRSSIKYRRPHE